MSACSRAALVLPGVLITIAVLPSSMLCTHLVLQTSSGGSHVIGTEYVLVTSCYILDCRLGHTF